MTQKLQICAGELSTRDKDRFERTGEVTRSVKPATEHILHEHDVFVLMQIVLERPSVYLHELYVTIGLTDFV